MNLLDIIRGLFGSKKYTIEGNANNQIKEAEKKGFVSPISVYTQPKASPTPTATPKPQTTTVKPNIQSTSRVLGTTSAGTYQPGEQNYMGVSRNTGNYPKQIPEPPKAIADLIWKYFPQDATAAATIAYGENGAYNPNAKNIWNRNGSVDYGLFQTNSNTMNEMLMKNKYRNILNQYGIYKPQDVMGDPEKGTVAAMVTKMYEKDAGASPWSWWYGWKDKGLNPYGYK